MPVVVSFEDYRPLPRYDGKAWYTARIEESPNAQDPWAPIETINLSPLDTDPTNPKARNFTTEDATEGYWYRIVFADQTGDEQLPTFPVKMVEDETLPYTPLVQQVAQLLRARTTDNFGNEMGTFTETTRPTFNDAHDIITQAVSDITAEFDTDIPEDAQRWVQQAAVYRAAMLIELTYWPEQVALNRSPYDQWRDLYNEFMGRVRIAVAREMGEAEIGDTDTSPGTAMYSFPEPMTRLREVM